MTVAEPVSAPFQMAAEMAEQPAVLARLLAGRADIIAAVGRLAPSPLRGVALVGRGSSEHAACFGRYLLEAGSGRPCVVVPPSLVAPPSLVVPPGPGAPYHGFLAIGISQSGETADVTAALAALSWAGAATLALTAAAGSPLAGAADLTVDVGAGVEQAVPATKSFTATLVALLLVAEAIGPASWTDDELEALPGRLAALLADHRPVEVAADRLQGHDRWGCVGGGVLEALAREAALKLEEVALVVADHHSATTFWHGPIATAGPCRPVLVFAAGPDDPALSLVRELRHRGSPVLVAAPHTGAELPLPAMPEPLLAVAAAGRAQQLALALAERRHLDPDHPPGLTKVTSP